MIKESNVKTMYNYPIKIVTNAKEAEEYPIINKDISKEFEEFFKIMRGDMDLEEDALYKIIKIEE